MLTIEEIKAAYEKGVDSAEADPFPIQRMSRVDDMHPRVMEVFMHPDYLKVTPELTKMINDLCKGVEGRMSHKDI
jgi:hypothetical protein